MSTKILYLVDGENLLHRYEAILNSGRIPKPTTNHKKDLYVWNPTLTRLHPSEIFRISFYTTFVGSHENLENFKQELAAITYSYNSSANFPPVNGHGTLVPYVYKKEGRSAQNKNVDINLTIDALRHTFNKDVDKIIICSGDGDFIPLIEEIMKNGVSVSVYAFSDGCNLRLKHIPDDFFLLDDIFFESNL